MAWADWARVGLWVGGEAVTAQGTCGRCLGYVREILEHAGVFYTEPGRDRLAQGRFDQAVLLFVGNVALSADEREKVEEHVAAGGAAVFVGYHSEAAELLGVRLATARGAAEPGFVPLGEGYLEPADHPITAGAGRPLHYFGGVTVEPAGATVVTTARDELGRPDPRPVVTERRVGNGIAILLAADIPGAVAHIQQGTFILADRPSAADGTINTCDGILKCDDGCALHYTLDRDVPAGDDVPCFAAPIADRWREVLIRSLLYAAQACGAPLPVLWYYPRNLPALAMLSFDSDGNDRALAKRHLDNCRRDGIRATWAIMEPGYGEPFLRTLVDAGMQVGLHYNALDPSDRPAWSRAAFERQLGFLRKKLGEQTAPCNKNHYTRWEGRLEFYRWCAENGIVIDESRGPSKRGGIGFPFGSCHPWFPMEDDGERLPVMEITFLTQDLGVMTPPAYGRRFTDWVLAAHGVAHLLFHPAHSAKEGVAEAMADFVSYARSLGMELWTDAEIHAWETARRRVALCSQERGFALAAEEPMPEATVLTLVPPGQAAPANSVERFGFTFAVREVDLSPGEMLQLAMG